MSESTLRQKADRARTSPSRTRLPRKQPRLEARKPQQTHHAPIKPPLTPHLLSHLIYTLSTLLLLLPQSLHATYPPTCTGPLPPPLTLPDGQTFYLTGYLTLSTLCTGLPFQPFIPFLRCACVENTPGLTNLAYRADPDGTAWLRQQPGEWPLWLGGGLVCYRPPAYWGEFSPGTITYHVVAHCRQYCACGKQESREEEGMRVMQVEDWKGPAERRGRPSRRRKWDGAGTEGWAGEGVDRKVSVVEEAEPVCTARERRCVGRRTRDSLGMLAGIDSESWG